MITKLINKEIDEISGAVQEITGYGIESLASSSRVRSLATARTLFCYFLHVRFSDFEIISNVLRRHKSNAYHLLKNHSDLMATDRLYQQYFKGVKNILNTNDNETEEN